eukprot:2724476-Pyramimonas_sp.AAC.1
MLLRAADNVGRVAMPGDMASACAPQSGWAAGVHQRRVSPAPANGVSAHPIGKSRLVDRRAPVELAPQTARQSD